MKTILPLRPWHFCILRQLRQPHNVPFPCSRAFGWCSSGWSWPWQGTGVGVRNPSQMNYPQWDDEESRLGKLRTLKIGIPLLLIDTLLTLYRAYIMSFSPSGNWLPFRTGTLILQWIVVGRCFHCFSKVRCRGKTTDPIITSCSSGFPATISSSCWSKDFHPCIAQHWIHCLPSLSAHEFASMYERMNLACSQHLGDNSSNGEGHHCLVKTTWWRMREQQDRNGRQRRQSSQVLRNIVYTIMYNTICRTYTVSAHRQTIRSKQLLPGTGTCSGLHPFSGFGIF